MVGFFLTCSQILDLGHFSQIILPIVLQTICPTIRCCSQHLMVGVNFFFLTSSPILDLGHFSQVNLPIVLQAICPPIRCCSQHLMVGVNFFLTSSPILDLGHFHKWFCQFYYKLCLPPKITPTIRCCKQHLMVGVNFFFDLFSHSGLRPFFTSDFTNCTRGYMPNHQVLFTAPDGWGYFFFTSDFANCTTDYAPTISCCSQYLMVGFFLPVLKFWT